MPDETLAEDEALEGATVNMSDIAPGQRVRWTSPANPDYWADGVVLAIQWSRPVGSPARPGTYEICLEVTSEQWPAHLAQRGEVACVAARAVRALDDDPNLN